MYSISTFSLSTVTVYTLTPWQRPPHTCSKQPSVNTGTWKSHWEQSWNKCRNTVLYKNILIWLHETLKNANQVNSFRTRPCLEISIYVLVNWIFIAFFHLWKKRINTIKPLEWQAWSQHSKPTLFSEIKPQRYQH